MLTMERTLKQEREIGYNISQIIKGQNMDIGQFAEMVQIPQIRIMAIITGSTNVQNYEINQMAEKLGVNKEEILRPVPDDMMKDYNIHYMGTATNSADMGRILDKADMYVRLLNAQSNT